MMRVMLPSTLMIILAVLKTTIVRVIEIVVISMSELS